MNRPCTEHGHLHRLIQPALADLTDKLRAGDRKITGPRQAILEVLRQHASPLTNREIHSLLADDCDLATVYRNIHTLVAMSLVKRVDIGDGAARWELMADISDGHHHHLICTGCQMIVEVDGCFPDDFEQELARRHGFAGVTHRLEFFGLCPKCQSEADSMRPPNTTSTATHTTVTGSPPT